MWPGYTPRHWVSFSSPPTTRRATVEIFEPRLYTGLDPRYIASGRTQQKTPFVNNPSIVARLFVAEERVYRTLA
jgi:hypothetical protein